MLLPLALLLCALGLWLRTPKPVHAFTSQTWYVRADGGTRFSVNVPAGQCDGQADVAYPGSGTNQHCAFNDFRYLYSDNSSHAKAWVMAGGDTAIVRGCAALPGQSNPSNPNCRIGSDNNVDNNSWCGPFGTVSSDCFPPPIPSGSSGQHTRILSTCAAAGNCQGGSATNPKLYASNLTQLFGGFGVYITLDFADTQYADFEGFEFTTHNGLCSIVGIPQWGGGCSTSSPYSDYANYGIRTTDTTANITFQDDYIHGFNAAGMWGPIGGPINMLRVFVGFNPQAGWNFDDGSGTPDAIGSALNWIHTIWEGNGCQEEYPIVHTFPAVRCWDSLSGGFGDAISGQGGAGMGSILTSLYMDDYQAILNTKDGFIGPHTCPVTSTIINSVSAFNMGQQWKWGACIGTPQTLTFANNLTDAGCGRMSAPLSSPGPFGLTAPSGYNTYLGDFCRAGGGTISSVISTGSVWNMYNNTFIFPGLGTVLLNPACPAGTSSCASTINWRNNVVLEYPNVSAVTFGGSDQSVLYNANNPTQIAINCSNEVEYGAALVLTCVTNPSLGITAGSGVIFSDPLLLNEPAQSVTAQSALDVFNTTLNTSSFYPTIDSPMLGAGTTGGPATDYFGVTQTSPATIGAVVLGGTPTAATPTFSPVVGTYTGTQSVTISTTTGGATLCYTMDGSAPTADGSGACTHGTTYSTAVSVASSLTLKAIASESGFLDSAVGSAAYVITALPPATCSGLCQFTGNVTITGR